MKKKMLSLCLIGLCSIALTACGDSTEKTTAEKERNKTETVSAPKETEKTTAEKESVKTEESGVYFKNDTLKIDMATIKLTGSTVAPPDKTFGEKKSTLIITYDFTNDSDKPLQPSTAFIACFTATQETAATIDRLDIAMSPQGEKYTKLNDMSNTDIKSGATVQSVISYEINDTKKPITLKATQGVAGKELGTKEYKIQ